MDGPRVPGRWIIDIEEGRKHTHHSKERIRWKRRCIFKVPPYFTSLNIDAYKPRVVSLGPYHHGKEHLKPMEAHKRRSLSHFLNRSSCSLKDLCDSLDEVTLQLMDHYEHLNEEWRDKDRFLELMVVDGCFLLEFLLSYTELLNHDYDDFDPIFGISTRGSVMYRNIRRDMILIENQLPVIVLQRLLALSTCKNEREVSMDIAEGILSLYAIARTPDGPYYCFSLDTPNCSTPNCKYMHVLDVLRDELIAGSWGKDGRTINATFPSATVLSSVGIKFTPTSPRDGVFISGHTLFLPYVVVNEDSETMFLNFIAMEQLQVRKGQRVSSYITFMDLLICSADDVKLLRDYGVIHASSRWSNRAIAKFFNDLAKNPMVQPDDSLAEVRMALKDYYESGKNIIELTARKVNEKIGNWGSYFKQTYCRNPWTVMGLVAGIIILALTAIQTYYAVLQYYDNNRSPPLHR